MVAVDMGDHRDVDAPLRGRKVQKPRLQERPRVGAGPPSISIRHGRRLPRRHSTSRQSPSRASRASMRMAVATAESSHWVCPY